MRHPTSGLTMLVGFVLALGLPGPLPVAAQHTVPGAITLDRDAELLALIRQLFQTWVCGEYLRKIPAAGRWVVAEDGTPPRPPKDATMHSFFRMLPCRD